MSNETRKNATRRVADLTVAELRQLITEVVSDEGDGFAKGISMEADLLLEKLRTLVVTSNPNWADVWANRWAEIAAHLERNLAEDLRAVDAPASSVSASDIAKELARYSDSELNSLLWHKFPKKDLVAIRAAVHKRLGVSAAVRGESAENQEAHRAGCLMVLSEALLRARDALDEVRKWSRWNVEAEHLFWLMEAVHNLPALFITDDVWDKSDVLGELASYDKLPVPEKLAFLADKSLRSIYEEAVAARTALASQLSDDDDSHECEVPSRAVSES